MKATDGEGPTPLPEGYGYTTGTCATAAVKGALMALITQRSPGAVRLRLPNGWMAEFSPMEPRWTAAEASCAVVKDAGRDPDVTHLAPIVATVHWTDGESLELDGGKGVGRVTKPGLPVAVGEAAINPVPRRMILAAAREVLEEYGIRRGVGIVISVPGGEEMAQKTLNPRLGIRGGISILGTRGVVVPFSTAAFRASIVEALQVALSGGGVHVVLTTGGRSEQIARDLLPELPEEAFVEMGDFVGFTLRHAKRLGCRRISLVGMMGKFSKVAQGVLTVHSKSAPVDLDFLGRVAAEAGAPPPLVGQVRTAASAAQASALLQEARLEGFFEQLCIRICGQALTHVGGGLHIATTLVTMEGRVLGRAETNG